MELKIVFLTLCFGVVYCGTSYKAAIVDTISFNEHKAVSMIQQAGQLNVDILMLPTMWSSKYGGNDKLRQALSDAAKGAKIYVTAQIVENSINPTENNLVFDRNGSITYALASSYHKTFVTDFGVRFGMVNTEDLLTSRIEGIRNVIAFGSPMPAAQFPYALQSPGAWAFVTRSNLITARAIFGARAHQNGGLLVADLHSDQPGSFEVERSLFWSENLGEYTSKPLRGSGRRQEKICHEHVFCCVFDVKTNSGVKLPYFMVASSGVQDVNGSPARLQTCALVTCLGQNDLCYEELERNKTNIEHVTISAHFTTNSTQYPLVITPSDVTYGDINFVQRNESNYASIESTKKDFIGFGIFGISTNLDEEQSQPEMNDDMSGLFDYLWIRLRVAIFIVSIYVLEML